MEAITLILITSKLVLGLTVGLFVKHFFVDFVFQTPYMYLNKGKFLHPGGITHSLMHGFTSWLFLMGFSLWSHQTVFGTLQTYDLSFSVQWIIAVCFVEFLAHYAMDWFKVNLCKDMGWKPDTSKYYWWMLGFDQLWHACTYFAMVYWFMRYYFVMKLIQ